LAGLKLRTRLIEIAAIHRLFAGFEQHFGSGAFARPLLRLTVSEAATTEYSDEAAAP
jgi:hypothetical protein